MLFAALLTSLSIVAPVRAAGPAHALERPASHEALLQASARDGLVLVVLFTLPGCPFCEAIRRDQLRHVAREQAERGLRLVEYDMTDPKRFADPAPRAGGPASPAALATSLGVRYAPTVVFLGPDGSELAERLVGYSSPDFYGAYLEQRIEQARARIGTR